MIAAFQQGDNERLAACYHDDIDWLFHAPVTLFPFAGGRRGKTEVFKGFAQMYQAYRLADYDYMVELIMVEGERAALCNSHLEQRAIGRIIRTRIAGFHRFQDGLLIEYRGFTDRFDADEQVLGRELDI